MTDSESDGDLKRAIALSLQDNLIVPGPHDEEVVDLVSDSEDEDDDLNAPVVARVILEKSRPTSMTLGSARKNNYQECTDDAAKPNAVPSVAPGLLGMDRKAMEAERLRRLEQRRETGQPANSILLQRKRPASASPPRVGDLEKAHVKPKLSNAKEPGTTRTSRGTHTTGERDRSNILSRNQQQSLLDSGIQYPNGVVKKTWVHGVPRRGDDIRIEEVLQSNDLELAVLSAFQIEAEWVQSKLRPQTKVVWVLQAKGEAEKENIRSDAPANYRFCFPNMEGNVNCMHSKLQLLAHPSHVRIVVPSANLTSYDWGETGIMENVCFLIDLPRLPPGQKTELTEFASELFRFIGAMGLDQTIVKSLQNFDFSHTASLAFVHSIGGSHLGSARERTGYCGLGRAVTKLGLATDEPLSIDFLSASIGSINDDCDHGMTEYGWRTDKPSKNKGLSAKERKILDGLKDCRIYFPTQETVAKSRGGLGGGGTICLQSKWFDSDVFPRHLMRDCKSKRPGILMHSKMILARAESSKQARWAGRLVKDRATKEPKLNIRNWECGVVLPIPKVSQDDAIDRPKGVQDPAGMDEVFGTLPIPMEVPGEAYGDRRPWFYNER
ncbi:hypothetical protein B2J93_6966 [Marssonina coronariae]|uniref:Phospholipase D/nuclease n=1 Tax=Diplocarpon coronariae TaxID=2795749 RepID=A0A218YWT7_9HELO|nr:hypothetical protein B2J93_6966 [Marssonina coronariae]